MKKARNIIVIVIILILLQTTIFIVKTNASFIDSFANWLQPISTALTDSTEADPIFTTGVDISAKGDGSAVAILSEDQTTLTINGTGEIKYWNTNVSGPRPWGEYIDKITTVNISEGITDLGDRTFEWCENIQKVNIYAQITRIGYRAFYGCTSLTRINIPEGVSKIEGYAFFECTNLRNISLPESLLTIGDSTFEDCTSLENIIIPEGVTTIGEYAFSECEKLSAIIIPAGVSSINGNAFTDCDRLTSITVDSNNTNYCSVDGVLFDKSKNTIIKYPCNKNGSVYNIPENTTIIGQYAFSECKYLSTIAMTEGITTIEKDSFRNCNNLYKINIPETIESIEEYLFYGCSNLVCIDIPERVRTIGKYAFSRCSNLISINIPEGVTTVGEYAFSGCNKLSTLNIPTELENIGQHAFYCTLTIAIPDKYEEQEIMPEILSRALDENDILHTTKDLTLRNCTMNETGDKVKVNLKTVEQKEVKIEINDGALSWLTINIVTSGKITYSTTDLTNKDVYAVLYIAEGETIINNNGSNIHQFEYNGEFEYKYITKDGEEKTAIAKVTNIDKVPPELTIPNYSTTEPTKNNVIVTIVSNEKVQEVEGWTLSMDKKTLTKIFNENTTEELIVRDLAGNETKATIIINNIDRTEPIIQIKKTLSQMKNACTVTIEANEKLQEINGWELSTNQKILTKVYNRNTTEELIVKDIAGNETKTKIIITEIEFEVENYIINNNKIINIQPNTIYTEFINNITSNKQYSITENNKVLTDTDIIKTGQVLTVGENIYTLVVTGDTNGDGKANIKDILQINKHRLNKNQLTNVYLDAGDVNGDGKTDIKDIMQINKYRLGKIANF